MRHLARTHRVSAAWLHEHHAQEHVELGCVSTDCMVAGVFAKAIHVPAKWTDARKLIDVYGGVDEWQDVIRRHRPKPHAPAVAWLCS